MDPPVLGTVDAVSVEIMPGLAARIAELRGHTIAVAALKPGDERITGFSNRCGIAAELLHRGARTRLLGPLISGPIPTTIP